ncbi:dihydroxyacetone kinase phosphoryl donor subunit DhaM [Georgenia halophila]|uniref:Phosphocarrier protein HPr n=1 Tax=Georgenia halophila TaxID=620889 RepID=A0ABP8L7R8_9MICO
MTARTALVVVSHSARLADGVVEVAAQMAPEVTLRAAGGTDDGGIGTSYTLVEAAVTGLLGDAAGVVILTDLGSATMTAESVVEMLEDPDRVTLADGPLVEGAVAAAVAAQGGAGHEEVARVVAAAGASFTGGTAAPVPEEADGGDGEAQTGTFVLVNEVGLHARPAAVLARLVAGYDAKVTVNGVDAASVLALMGLGLEKGDEIQVTASGEQATEALAGVAGAVADGFGEGAAR